MLPPRIEQEAGAGFDDAAYVLSMEKLLCFAKLPRVRFVWVERVMIECQRYAYEYGVDKPEVDAWKWPW